MKHKLRLILTFSKNGRAVITNAETNETMTAEETMKAIRQMHGTERSEPIYIGMNSDDLKHETKAFSVTLADEVINGKREGMFMTRQGIAACVFKTDTRGEYPVIGIVRHRDRDQICQWDNYGREREDEKNDLLISIVKDGKKTTVGKGKTSQQKEASPAEDQTGE